MQNSSFQLHCPLCNATKNNQVLLSGSLYRCKFCRCVFNQNYAPLIYDEDYFNADYKKQYGKTYLEDFDTIYRLSISRLNFILKESRLFGNPGTVRLLDIGSALGFFLKAAVDTGIEAVKGIEVSKYAADYCKRVYNFDIIASPFEEAKIEDVYDIITAWYFIEHCREPLAVIKRIFGLLRTGGVFAFSAPSIFGPMYFFHRSDWVESHPVDHHVDFSPFTVKKIFSDAGFSKVVVRFGSIHPERFIVSKSPLFFPFKKFYSIISRFLSFSDTINVVAVK